MSPSVTGDQGGRCVRRRIVVRGLVQGVGFRPFVYELARSCGLTGHVGNNSSGVFIEVQGTSQAVDLFLRDLSKRAPALAVIETVSVEEQATREESDFVIVASEPQAELSTPIPPDIATCVDCLRELFDPSDRRYRYPFLNCTNCGPRFTIVRDLPYDRGRTTMAAFTMCSACRAEYQNPADRRYHAQPVACPVCGPRLWFVPAERAGEAAARPSQAEDWPQAEDALRAFHEVLSAGGIVAVKGLGGFHLVCDATNDEALALLRERKGRVDKPFALMAGSLARACDYVEIDDDEERLLTSRARPIVLLRRRIESKAARPLSEKVAPGNVFLGFMLPYTPLHHLLVEDRPLVMTSGNVSDEPIARENDEALTRLLPLADAFLLHDRPIHVVCDDSVMRVRDRGEVPVRRSRGYAPLPIPWPWSGPGSRVLAVGGELKLTFCLAKPPYAYLSQHIGDMGNFETLEAFERAQEHFRVLFRAEPELVACDRHPGYLSAEWARRFADHHGLPLVAVQHHHAHAASVMLENGLDGSTPVISLIFDGTGYGTDGAIWGGEVLLADYRDFRRFAHLKYIPLPGGDVAVRRPYRVALAHLWAAELAWDEDLPCVSACPKAERGILVRQLESGLNCVPTSSMGRLFDAVASLIGLRHTVTYEAQAAIEMESKADEITEGLCDRFTIEAPEAEGPLVIDPAPVLQCLISELRRGVPPEVLAARFHNTVAEMALDLARRARDRSGSEIVALSGGVFQNMLLTDLVVRQLREDQLQVISHGRVPPNDGGISLGQAAVACASQRRSVMPSG